MKVINVKNVHQALPIGLSLLQRTGIRRDSRNGPVLQAPTPVATVYQKPMQRVVFYPERDANPFFHLYESLWMLAGRNDVEGPARYAKQMRVYSDDGETFHGAYGYRWRNWFNEHVGYEPNGRCDQLKIIAQMLRDNPNDRRAVLQMWDAEADLGATWKDLPCNDTATFQRGPDGELNLVVFCRSNDIIWGAYGANAVHFSMLLEYMALWIGCAVGIYTQVSVNYHAYLDVMRKVEAIIPDPQTVYPQPFLDPYYRLQLDITSMSDNRGHYIEQPGIVTVPMAGDGNIQRIDELIETLLDDADNGFPLIMGGPEESWAATVYFMLLAHHIYKRNGVAGALQILDQAPIQNADWIVAGREWLERRVKRNG